MAWSLPVDAWYRWHVRHRQVVACVLALSALGCGSAASAPRAAPDVDQAPASRMAGAPALAEGTVAMEQTCEDGADERCDALDSDCDGRIDEGCDGATTTGAIDVAVAWNGAADLDLTLDGPGAADARVLAADGACGDALDRLERRSLDRGAAGRYEVGLRHADACGGDGAVTASVTVAVGGRVLGTFNREIAAGESAAVVAFDVE